VGRRSAERRNVTAFLVWSHGFAARTPNGSPAFKEHNSDDGPGSGGYGGLRCGPGPSPSTIRGQAGSCGPRPSLFQGRGRDAPAHRGRGGPDDDERPGAARHGAGLDRARGSRPGPHPPAADRARPTRRDRRARRAAASRRSRCGS
jgi:hypothetical protein